jgi:hypothetical protein
MNARMKKSHQSLGKKLQTMTSNQQPVSNIQFPKRLTIADQRLTISDFST